MLTIKFHFIRIFLFLISLNLSQVTRAQTNVILHTSYGDIKIMLYEETVKHQQNFIKLLQQGYYDGLLFHRVIPSFMIQTGDPNSRTARPGQALGNDGPSYTIPAEFNPLYYHKRGAVAAARLSDDVNPGKESSGSQFYIVQGTVYSDSQLNMLERTNRHLPFTPEQRNAYTILGGSPHLDNGYTVFGEVTEGHDIIDKISAVVTDERKRPISDIRIIKAYVVE